MNGYNIEILSLHALHRPFKKIHEIKGILSYQEIMQSHLGHLDLDVKNDFPNASLKPTTFKNDPQHNPNKKTKNISVFNSCPFY